jgi:hypothetical protein
MMRRPGVAFVGLAVVLGAAILYALAWSPAVVTPGPRREQRRLNAADAPPPGSPTGAGASRIRNVFVYDEPTPAPLAPRVFVPEVAVPPPLALPPPSPVALVGFVRQGGGLRAALSIRGSVSVLGKDESADGYVVLAIDEDRGVTLRAPDGTETTLASPPAP